MIGDNKFKWKTLLNDLNVEFNLYTDLLTALSAIDRSILDKKITLKETFDLISTTVSKVLNAENVQILQDSGDGLVISSSTVKEHVGNKVSLNSMSGKCLESAKFINISDLNEYSDIYKQYFGTKKLPMRSELVVPIFVSENGKRPFGVINIESAKRSAYDESHIEMLEAISQQTSIAIKHANIIDGSSFSEDRRKFLKGDVEIEYINKALEKYSKKIKTTLNDPLSEFQIAFVDGPYLEIVLADDIDCYGLKVSIEDSVAGESVVKNKTIRYGDIRANRKYKKLVKKEMSSEIVVPISLENEVIAAINVESEEINAFSQLDQFILEKFSQQTSELIALIRLQWMRYKAVEKKSADSAFIAITDKVGNDIHRINNFASSIKNNALYIKEFCLNKNNDSEIPEMVENIIISADKVLQIPKKLKKNIIDVDNVNPNKVISVVLERISPSKLVNVKLNLDKKIKRMNLFSFDIVVETLLNNSIDAINEKGSNSGNIEILTRIIDFAGERNKYFSFSIVDNGKGIKQESIKNIYDPGFSTKEGKTGSGLGYGLWWVKSFVTRNRGYIIVESTYNQGTKFEIRFPLKHLK